MKGRRILRPNTQRGQLVARMMQAAGFNEGPKNSSAKLDQEGHRRRQELASMKGRRILRPNLRTYCTKLRIRARFNEGPKNSSAKRHRSARQGRPHRACFNEGPKNSSAKPDPAANGRHISIDGSFNEGPKNSSAKQGRHGASAEPAPRFNEGPKNSSAKRKRGSAQRSPISAASMKGRRILRPNLMAELVVGGEQRSCFNEGPKNSSAKLRDVMVEGPSGLLPFNEGPKNSSAKLTLPTGRSAVPRLLQ